MPEILRSGVPAISGSGFEFHYGDMKEPITLNVLGKHKGYQLFTVGQRRGLGINLGKMCFITNIIPEENLIILGEFQDLMKKSVKVINYKFNEYFISK